MGSLRPTNSGQEDNLREAGNGFEVAAKNTSQNFEQRFATGILSNIKRNVVYPAVIAIAGVMSGSCAIEKPNNSNTEEVKPYPGYEHCAPLRMCGVAPEIKEGVPTAVMFDYEYSKTANEGGAGPLIELTVMNREGATFSLASFHAQDGYNQPTFSLQGIPEPRDVKVTIDGNEIDATYPLIRGL